MGRGETDWGHRLATRLKMKHLLLLVAIREHRSLTRVAQELSTSQPAVTQSLAELEGLFGGQLFSRTHQGMVATALGDLVLSRCQTMLADLRHWARDMDAVGEGRAAHLHVGVIPFLPGRLLARAIGRARHADKPMTVTLHEGTSDHLLERLRRHELDCVIGRTSAVLDMSGLQHEVLYPQIPRLVAHRKLARRLERQPLVWSELTGLDWILGPRSTPMREQITDFFLRAGVKPPPPFVESLSSKVIGELVAANERAVSIVPDDVARELVRTAGVAIVSHPFTWTLPPVTLFQREAGALFPEARLFARELRAASAEMPA
jgi:DNA-binding transcriptional LysR family regulator